MTDIIEATSSFNPAFTNKKNGEQYIILDIVMTKTKATGDWIPFVFYKKQIPKNTDSPTTVPAYFSKPTTIFFEQFVPTSFWLSANPEQRKEFMKIMKPKDKKEDVQYVNNLLDYLDKPELIQFKGGSDIRALHYFPDNQDYSQVVVVFEDGVTSPFHSNGKPFSKALTSSFILKPKENKYFEGWRRAVRTSDGRIFIDTVACPTKKEFMEGWDCHNSHFGPWERVKFGENDD